jgi:Na+/phosphate symporter
MSLFILELVFFVSFAVIVFLFIRKLPYISDVVLHSPQKKDFSRYQWIDKIDRKLIELLSKWLRRIKLVVMRLDNYVSNHIEKIKQRHSSETIQQNILREIEQEVIKQKDQESNTEESKEKNSDLEDKKEV